MSRTTAEMIRCVEREIMMRKSVYPRWVHTKKMTELKAALEIETMEDVLALLRRKDAAERLL